MYQPAKQAGSIRMIQLTSAQLLHSEMSFKEDKKEEG